MANLPRHRVKSTKVHEWIIGEGEGPVPARDLRDGIFFAEKEMEGLGIDTSYDDAYEVIADGYEIVLRVQVEDEK